MLLYPEPIKDYPLEWVQDLARVREKSQVIRLEKKDIHGLVTDPDLLVFYQRIEELTDIPFIKEYPEMPTDPHSFLYMIPKKQYEVKRLAPFIHAFYENQNISKIVDIGGGIGLLAQTLTKHYGHCVESLDMDPVLQQTGEARSLKLAKDSLNKVKYRHIKVEENNPLFLDALEENSLSVGLHTCGPLANSQIRASGSKKISGIINFGCCYQKLENIPSAENISQFAQNLDSPLVMTRFALTLACRAHRKMNEIDYDLKLKVKFYRYAIHMLLHDHYGHRKLATLGNSNPKLYDQSFGVYAHEQLSRISEEPKHTLEELDQYFQSENVQNLIWNMLAAGLIRNALGRVMELYLLLDRVLYLEEQGYDVELLQFFDEETSPRNLGIVARRI